MNRKQLEQGRKDGNKGWAVVIRGGDGQEIHPNIVTKTGVDEIGIFEIKSAGDSRVLSTIGLNGLYKIRAYRTEQRALITITFINTSGIEQPFAHREADAIDVRDNINSDQCDFIEIKNLTLRENIMRAATLAVLRTFNEQPESYSLEAKAPVDVVQAQLAARSQVGRPPQKKEHNHGRHRPHRTVASTTR